MTSRTPNEMTMTNPFSQDPQNWKSQPQYPQQPFAQQPYAPPQPAQDPQYPQYPVAYTQPQMPAQQQAVAFSPKSKAAAAILAFFLGGLGAHNFYLGYTGKGFCQLALLVFGVFTSLFVIGFLMLGALSLWVLIEFIMILTGGGAYTHDSVGRPLS